MTTRRRRCKAKTKKGTRCKATPLRAEDYCLAHHPGKDEISPGFGGPQLGAGRPRNPSPREAMQAALDEHAIEFVQTYLHAARTAMVFAKYEGEVRVSEFPDYGARINAIERLLDRVEGKPRQQTEITGAGGAPIEVNASLDLNKLTAVELRTLSTLLRKADAPATDS